MLQHSHRSPVSASTHHTLHQLVQTCTRRSHQVCEHRVRKGTEVMRQPHQSSSKMLVRHSHATLWLGQQDSLAKEVPAQGLAVQRTQVAGSTVPTAGYCRYSLPRLGPRTHTVVAPGHPLAQTMHQGIHNAIPEAACSPGSAQKSKKLANNQPTANPYSLQSRDCVDCHPFQAATCKHAPCQMHTDGGRDGSWNPD